MAIVEISIAPLGTRSPSISEYVAACHDVLQSFPDIQWQLTPMGTVLTGELPRIMDVVLKMHEVPFTKGAVRVSTIVKIEDYRDKQANMEVKVQSMQDKSVPGKI